jgi:hypothetical protein
MYASEYYLMIVILDMHVSSNFCFLFVSFPEEIDFVGSLLFKLQTMINIPEKDGHFLDQKWTPVWQLIICGSNLQVNVCHFFVMLTLLLSPAINGSTMYIKLKLDS